MNYFNDIFRNTQPLVEEMNKINKLFQQSQSAISQLGEPIMLTQQEYFKTDKLLDFPLEQFYASQQSLYNAFETASITSLANMSAVTNVQAMPIVSNLNELFNSIPFEVISKIDLTFLDELTAEDLIDDEQPFTKEVEEDILQEIEIQKGNVLLNRTAGLQDFIMVLYQHVPTRIFLGIMLFIFTPFINYSLEEPKALIQEFWEDKTGIDMAGEKVSMIRTQTYLRAGRSKRAPLVLQDTLQEAQSVLRITRKGNWVKISVLINGETHTGWVEKSKVI